MPIETTNYGFIKDDEDEFYNVLRVNANLDKIDTEMKRIENKTNITVPVTKVNGKTGDVILSAGDIKTSENKTIEETLQSHTSTMGDYAYDVVTSDTDGKPTKATYKRADNTLYKEVTCSNKDSNGFYQTIVEKTYDINGTTLKQTKTYTLTYNADGIIQTKRWVIA
jgi:hypothetical protein